MKLPIYQLDAFAERVFAGNPAAVCPLEAWLSDALLQAVAAENNLAETAYLVERQDGDYDLRWFTPAIEVDLCGHATLASAEVVFTHLRPQAVQVRFHTRSGPLTVTREEGLLTMDFPARPPHPATAEEAAAVAAALGGAPAAVLRSDKFLALLADEGAVLAAAPDMAAVAALPGDGLIVTAEGRDCDFVSRYFAPHAGIPEDPVTGSAHCVLTPFWAERLGRNPLRARQVSRRGGEVGCRLSGDRVFLSGRVVPYLEGSIAI